jgi:beta-galactosidase
VRTGGYPGAFRELLGIRTEEFFPLPPGQTPALDNGSAASLWTEALHLEGAEAKVSLTEGHLAGTAAVTRNRHGSGDAWYIGTVLDPAALRGVVTEAAAGAGITLPAFPEGLEAVSRSNGENTYLFLINHSEEEHKYAAQGHELILGEDVSTVVAVPAGAVRVVRTSTPVPPTAGLPAGQKDVESV